MWKNDDDYTILLGLKKGKQPGSKIQYAQPARAYNYVYICINSSTSSSLWSARSTFRVLAFTNIPFQTLFALEFRAAAALHRKWKKKQNRTEQNKNTTIRTSHITMSHKCMQKRRTMIIAYKMNTHTRAHAHMNAHEMERVKKQNTTKELELHDRWTSERFSITTQQPHRTEINAKESIWRIWISTPKRVFTTLWLIQCLRNLHPSRFSKNQTCLNHELRWNRKKNLDTKKLENYRKCTLLSLTDHMNISRVSIEWNMYLMGENCWSFTFNFA